MILQKVLARSHAIFGAWYQIYIENIHLLNAPCDKWTGSGPPLVEGDVVLFIALETTTGSKKDGVWRLGRVLSVTDRRVQIDEVLKSGTKTILERNPRDISLVISADEYAVNTRAYFSRLEEAKKNPTDKPTL